MSNSPPAPPSFGSVIRSVAVSIGFWTCLLISAGCFAAVTLSPKYLQYLQLKSEIAASQHKLVALERQTLQLREVVAALEQDPAFAEELARVEFDAVRPDEEILAVDPGLRLNPHASVSAPETRLVDAPSWMPMVIVLAQAQDVRAALLLVAATLTIVGFTWLHEPSGVRHNGRTASARPSLGERLRARYRAP